MENHNQHDRHGATYSNSPLHVMGGNSRHTGVPATMTTTAAATPIHRTSSSNNAVFGSMSNRSDYPSPCEELDGPFRFQHQRVSPQSLSAPVGQSIAIQSVGSYSQMSTHHVDSSKVAFNIPPSLSFSSTHQRDPVEDVPTSPQRRGLRMSAEVDSPSVEYGGQNMQRQQRQQQQQQQQQLLPFISGDSRQDPREMEQPSSSEVVVDDLDLYLMSSQRRRRARDDRTTDDENDNYIDFGNDFVDYDTNMYDSEGSCSRSGTNERMTTTATAPVETTEMMTMMNESSHGLSASTNVQQLTDSMMLDAEQLLGLPPSTVNRMVSVGTSMTSTTSTSTNDSPSPFPLIDGRRKHLAPSPRSGRISGTTISSSSSSHDYMIRTSYSEDGSPKKRRRSRHSRSNVVLNGNSFILVPNPDPLVDQRSHGQNSTATMARTARNTGFSSSSSSSSSSFHDPLGLITGATGTGEAGKAGNNSTTNNTSFPLDALFPNADGTIDDNIDDDDEVRRRHHGSHYHHHRQHHHNRAQSDSVAVSLSELFSSL